jgi:hypothetical protein
MRPRKYRPRENGLGQIGVSPIPYKLGVSTSGLGKRHRVRSVPEQDTGAPTRDTGCCRSRRPRPGGVGSYEKAGARPHLEKALSATTVWRLTLIKRRCGFCGGKCSAIRNCYLLLADEIYAAALETLRQRPIHLHDQNLVTTNQATAITIFLIFVDCRNGTETGGRVGSP